MLKKELVDRLLSQQTTISRKVYQAIPIEDSWSHVEIYREFVRIHGTAVELRVVGGCVSSLIASGLVRQVQRDRYRREPVKETPPPKVRVAHANRHVNPPIDKSDLEVAVPQTDATPLKQDPKKTITMAKISPIATAAKPAKKDPLERLLNLSEQLAALTESSRKIAEEISELTLELTDERELITKEKEQVQQLRALLGTFMAPATTNG